MSHELYTLGVILTSAQWLDNQVKKPSLDFRIRNFLFLNNYYNGLLVRFLDLFHVERYRPIPSFEMQCKLRENDNCLANVLYSLGCPHIHLASKDFEDLVHAYQPITILLDEAQKQIDEKTLLRAVYSCLTKLYATYGGILLYSPHNEKLFKNALARIINVFHELLGYDLIDVPANKSDEPPITKVDRRLKENKLPKNSDAIPEPTDTDITTQGDPVLESDLLALTEPSTSPSTYTKPNDRIPDETSETPQNFELPPENLPLEVCMTNDSDTSNGNGNTLKTPVLKKISEPLRTRLNMRAISKFLALPTDKQNYWQGDYFLIVFKDFATLLEAIWNDTYIEDIKKHEHACCVHLNTIAVNSVYKRFCDLDIWDVYDLDEHMLTQRLDEFDVAQLLLVPSK